MNRLLLPCCFLLGVCAAVLLVLCPFTGQEPGAYALAAVDALPSVIIPIAVNLGVLGLIVLLAYRGFRDLVTE